MFPWTTTLHFWQTLPKFFRQKLDNFLQLIKSESDEKNCNFSKKILITFLWRHQMQFWETSRKFLPKFRKCFAQSLKTLRSYFFSEKISSKDSSGHVECIFDHPADIFSPNVRNWIKNQIYFSQKKFIPSVLLWTRRMQFWQAFRRFCAKSWTDFRSYSESDENKCNFFKKILKHSCGHVICSFE